MIPVTVIDEIEDAIEIMTASDQCDQHIVSALSSYEANIKLLNVAVKSGNDARSTASVILAYVLVFESMRLSEDFTLEERSVLNDLSFTICSYVDYLTSIAGGVDDVA